MRWWQRRTSGCNSIITDYTVSCVGRKQHGRRNGLHHEKVIIHEEGSSTEKEKKPYYHGNMNHRLGDGLHNAPVNDAANLPSWSILPSWFVSNVSNALLPHPPAAPPAAAAAAAARLSPIIESGARYRHSTLRLLS